MPSTVATRCSCLTARCTTAEMPPEDKDALSHRGQAFRALAPLLAEALREPSADAP